MLDADRMQGWYTYIKELDSTDRATYCRTTDANATQNYFFRASEMKSAPRLKLPTLWHQVDSF